MTGFSDVNKTSTTALEYVYDRHMVASRELTTDNLSRELLRLLPSQISSGIKGTVNDERLLALWERFAGSQLHNVLQHTLNEITGSNTSQ